jgi:phospholipase C
MWAPDQTEQIDNGQENATDDQTMAFYNQNEIPFYYDLAQKFAVNDQNFSPVLLDYYPVWISNFTAAKF